MSGAGSLVLYTTEDGLAQIQLRAVDGTVWLTQSEIAELFNTTPQNVTIHLGSLYGDAELDEAVTCKESLQVQLEGGRQVRRSLKIYNLDAILAVGYRVRSPRGIQFRRWASTVLRAYLVKGFAMDDAKLRGADQADYFDELLARIRDIRASEKRFYQKVRDLFAATSVDYEKGSEQAKTFFATIQNKLVFAATGQTAAELVVSRADSGMPNMALTSWGGTRVRKADVTVAKNYLNDDEIDVLNRLTTGFLDAAELRAQRREQARMADWVTYADRFLAFSEQHVLRGAGSVSRERMEAVVHERFTVFDLGRRSHEAEQARREDQVEIDALIAATKAGDRA